MPGTSMPSAPKVPLRNVWGRRGSACSAFSRACAGEGAFPFSLAAFGEGGLDSSSSSTAPQPTAPGLPSMSASDFDVIARFQTHRSRRNRLRWHGPSADEGGRGKRHGIVRGIALPRRQAPSPTQTCTNKRICAQISVLTNFPLAQNPPRAKIPAWHTTLPHPPPPSPSPHSPSPTSSPSTNSPPLSARPSTPSSPSSTTKRPTSANAASPPPPSCASRQPPRPNEPGASAPGLRPPRRPQLPRPPRAPWTPDLSPRRSGSRHPNLPTLPPALVGWRRERCGGAG